MKCTEWEPVKSIVLGRAYHIASPLFADRCLTVIYLGFLRSEQEIDGVKYRRGRQFLILDDLPELFRVNVVGSSPSEREKLMRQIHHIPRNESS